MSVVRAILLIDHGSRRAEANTLLGEVAARVKERIGDDAIVEAAHMEIAEPTIAQGFARCVELGLANKAVPSAELRDSAVAWGEALAKRAPLSIAATKKVMRHAMDYDWGSCFNLEAELQGKLQQSADAREGVDAFLEKREPEFKGE